MNARSHREMMCSNITCLETIITSWKVRETLTEKEQRSVSKMVKKLEALSAEVKNYHCTVLDQTEEQENWL